MNEFYITDENYLFNCSPTPLSILTAVATIFLDEHVNPFF